jgi:hypothetical protein
MNVAFGLKTGLVMAAIFALSDGAKIILPMIDAALGGSTPKRSLAYWTAVLVSVLAERPICWRRRQRACSSHRAHPRRHPAPVPTPNGCERNWPESQNL